MMHGAESRIAVPNLWSVIYILKIMPYKEGTVSEERMTPRWGSNRPIGNFDPGVTKEGVTCYCDNGLNRFNRLKCVVTASIIRSPRRNRTMQVVYCSISSEPV